MLFALEMAQKGPPNGGFRELSADGNNRHANKIVQCGADFYRGLHVLVVPAALFWVATWAPE